MKQPPDDTARVRDLWIAATAFLFFGTLAFAHYFPGSEPRATAAEPLAESVEKPAMLRRQQPTQMRYPEQLRDRNVEGKVIAEFVVDTDGRPDISTYRELESSHELFSEAVRAYVPGMRFHPAENGGEKIRMWVQMPFNFRLTP